MILGAGIGGSHTAYRLAPIHQKNVCIFERNSYVGGRTYDRSYNGTVPPAYSNISVSAQGAQRFFDGQPVIKQLADELEIPYYRYDYQTNIIKARGKLYASYSEMCSASYVNLTCNDDANGYSAVDQLWVRLINEYHRNKSSLYQYADFNAFCRAILGDEATDYLRDSFRFRGDFEDVNAYSYMEYTDQDWNLVPPIYYPYHGMSQLAKRMMYRATQENEARLYLKEEILRIDDHPNPTNNYIFSIETSHYRVRAKQLVLAMNPSGWKNIQGSIAQPIKANEHFQSIAPVPTVTIQCYWPNRWWEESSLFGGNIDRAWTRQNCISIIEIISQHPYEREQNLTRTVYDDGLCVGTWSALITRLSQADLIQEILRGLQSIFTDVQIPPPTKVFTNVWPGAWHFQKRNSRLNNTQIVHWALKPLQRFDRQQLSLVGEAFLIDRSGWTDAAVKSSLITLTSQFSFAPRCFENDAAAGGQFCSSARF